MVHLFVQIVSNVQVNINFEDTKLENGGTNLILANIVKKGNVGNIQNFQNLVEVDTVVFNLDFDIKVIEIEERKVLITGLEQKETKKNLIDVLDVTQLQGVPVYGHDNVRGDF